MTKKALRRLDANAIPENGAAEVRVLIVTRNEAQRLPWLLTYYRSRGAARFFVIDNGSDDGSVAFLARQDDCHVFSTSDSFLAANFGVVWHQEILEQYGEAHWWLIVDADEIFVYPACESVSLPAFCRYLEASGDEAVYALFLDMYSRGPVAEAAYTPGVPFTDVCPWFDAEYKFQPRLRIPFRPPPFPSIEPVGGPRLRRFYPEFAGSRAWPVLRNKVIRKFRDMLGKVGIVWRIACPVPPLLFKVPLRKWRRGDRLINSHFTLPIKLSPVTGALLHFKYFADFHERAAREVARGEHFDGGSEYRRYLDAMRTDPRLSLFYEGSVRYEGSQQLVELGLIHDDPSYAARRAQSD